MLCKHCNCDSKFVCQTCGAVVDEAELQAELRAELQAEMVRPFDVEWYKGRLGQFICADHALFDKVIPYIMSSSTKILFHFLAGLKGESNVAFEKGYTTAELMVATGIKSPGTMHQALCELSYGLAATKRRRALFGWDVIKCTNADKKSKFRTGNRWVLNLNRILEGEEYPLFYAGGQGRYVPIHRWIITELFPTLTPDQCVILLFIFRLTIGFDKQKDSITLNYFTGARREVEGKETPIPRHRSGLTSYAGVKAVLKQLVDLGIITDEDPLDPRNGRIYGLNPSLSVPSHLHATLNHLHAKRDSPPRDVESPPRDVESPPRETPPPNSASKQVFPNASETTSLNPPAQNGSSALHEISAALPKTTDGTQLPKNGETPAPMSRTAREAILKHTLGIKRKENLDKALDLLQQGVYRTDSDIEKAIKHKEKNPKTGGGVYSNYFTMKPKPDGTMYELFDMESPSENPSLNPNEPDTAPKSPPPTNGNGAAPHSPTYANGDEPPPLPSPATVWQVTQDLLNQNPLLLNGLGKNLPYLQLESIENGLITVTAPPRVAESLTKQPGVMTRALNQAMQHLDQDNGGHGWRVRFVSNVAQSDDAVWWHDTKAALQQQMTQATYSSVIRGTVFMACEGNVFVIGVRNKMALDWLENRLVNTVQRVLSSVVGKEVTVKFELLEAL